MFFHYMERSQLMSIDPIACFVFAFLKTARLKRKPCLGTKYGSAYNCIINTYKIMINIFGGNKYSEKSELKHSVCCEKYNIDFF